MSVTVRAVSARRGYGDITLHTAYGDHSMLLLGAVIVLTVMVLQVLGIANITGASSARITKPAPVFADTTSPASGYRDMSVTR